MPPDVRAWPGVEPIERVEGGHRNEVWSGRAPNGQVAIRSSRRSSRSLAWELDLVECLGAQGFLVPRVIPTVDGEPEAGGIVVQEWIEGREPSTTADWRLVAAELSRLHVVMSDHAQRPGCVSVAELDRRGRSVDADLAALPDDVAAEVLAVFTSVRGEPTTVVHGDPGPSNLLITADGRVGLLDWDESRVDVPLHDLSNLGIQVLPEDDHARAERLSDAWEVANAWLAEPEYARWRLDRLRRAGHDG